MRRILTISLLMLSMSVALAGPPPPPPNQAQKKATKPVKTVEGQTINLTLPKDSISIQTTAVPNNIVNFDAPPTNPLLDILRYIVVPIIVALITTFMAYLIAMHSVEVKSNADAKTHKDLTLAELIGLIQSYEFACHIVWTKQREIEAHVNQGPIQLPQNVAAREEEILTAAHKALSADLITKQPPILAKAEEYGSVAIAGSLPLSDLISNAIKTIYSKTQETDATWEPTKAIVEELINDLRTIRDHKAAKWYQFKKKKAPLPSLKQLKR